MITHAFNPPDNLGYLEDVHRLAQRHIDEGMTIAKIADTTLTASALLSTRAPLQQHLDHLKEMRRLAEDGIAALREGFADRLDIAAFDRGEVVWLDGAADPHDA